MNDGNFRATSTARPDEIDDRTLRERLDRLVSMMWRALPFWKGILGIFLATCGVALYLALTTERIYRSECKILVKSGIRTNDREAPSILADKVAARLKEVLLTRPRLEPIIKEYKLYPADVEGKGMNDAVEEMRMHIGFRPSGENTFTVSFEDSERERTRSVTQRLAETTIADYKHSSLSKAEQEVEFYSGQVAKSQEELVKAETTLYAFHAAHPEFPVAITPSGVPQLGVQNTVHAPTAAPDPILADLYKKKAQIESEARIDGKPVANSNTELAQATLARDEADKRLREARTHLAEKMASGLTEAHPDVSTAKTKVESATQALAAAQSQLDKAKGAAVQPLPAGALSAESQAKLGELNTQIARRLDDLKRKSPPLGSSVAVASSSPVADWQRFTSDVNLRRLRFDDLQKNLKEKELEARASKGSEFLEVLEPAFMPTHPFKGGRTKTAVFGLLAALLLAFGYALLRVLFDDTIVDADDVRLLHRTIQVLGVIPRVPVLSAPSEEKKR